MKSDDNSQKKEDLGLNIFDLRNLWAVIKEKKYLIGAIVLLGVFVVVAAWFLRDTIYVKGILISLPDYQENIIHADELRTIISDLNGMVERDAKDMMVEKGIFAQADIEDITGIFCAAAKGEEGIFTLVIKSKSQDNIANVARDVAYHLNDHPIIKDRIEKQINLLNNQIELCSSAVNNAQELKATFFDTIKTGRAVDLGFNVVDIEQSIRDMKMELEDLQRKTELFKGFEIISNLDVPSEPEGFGIFRSLGISILISLFIGIIVAIFTGWKKINSDA